MTIFFNNLRLRKGSLSTELIETSSAWAIIQEDENWSGILFNFWEKSPNMPFGSKPVCTSCHTTEANIWRKNENNEVICNDCHLGIKRDENGKADDNRSENGSSTKRGNNVQWTHQKECQIETFQVQISRILCSKTSRHEGEKQKGHFQEKCKFHL